MKTEAYNGKLTMPKEFGDLSFLYLHGKKVWIKQFFGQFF